MKRQIPFIVILILLSLSIKAQSVAFTVTSITDNGNFSPKHVLAIWVKKADGTFVRSLKVMANARKQYLYSWNKNSAGNSVDATTGATLTAHLTHTVTWDCKDVNKTLVANGDYKMMIEFTDQHAQGPMDSITFTVSASAQHLAPAAKTYFKDKVLDFAPAVTGIENVAGNQYLATWPNPSHGLVYVNFSTEEPGTIKIRVFDAAGHKVQEQKVQQTSLTNYPLQIPSVKSGVYILEIEVNKKTIRQKLIMASH